MFRSNIVNSQVVQEKKMNSVMKLVGKNPVMVMSYVTLIVTVFVVLAMLLSDANKKPNPHSEHFMKAATILYLMAFHTYVAYKYLLLPATRR